MVEGERWRKYVLLQQISTGEASLDGYSPRDLKRIAEGAMLVKNVFDKKSKLEKEILQQDLRMIRRAVYLCFSTGKEEHAAALAEGIINSPGIRDKENDERVEAAIGSLSAFSSRGASGKAAGVAKGKIIELLGNEDPSVQIAVIKSLTNGDDFEIFERVAVLLDSDNSRVRNAALAHLERILCEIAFRGEEGEKLAGEVVVFLKKTLTLLERLQVDVMVKAEGDTVKRLNLMIVLTYNHILRDMYREAEMTGGREMRPYMAVLGHFTDSAPAFVGLLAKRLCKSPAELGMDTPLDSNIKVCVISALELMGANESARGKIMTSLRDFCGAPGIPKRLKEQAKAVVEQLEKKNFRYSMPPKPPIEARKSIVPGSRRMGRN